MTRRQLRWAFNALRWQPTETELNNALSCISLEEQKRIQRFQFKRDFLTSLAGRLMIRRCIKQLLGVPWLDIQLGRTDKGKPILLDQNLQQRISFNVSHQGEYTVLAACTSSSSSSSSRGLGGNQSLCSNTMDGGKDSCELIGIDIMQANRPHHNTTLPNFFRIMKRQFTQQEWDFIESWSEDRDKLASFYRLWCLKESVVKATGGGIGTSSAGINCQL